MYKFNSRIRYSEVGRDSNLTLLSLIDYFQDCSTFHSEDLGIGVKRLGELKLAWVLNFWQIDIDRYPSLGECVEIATHPYEFKKYMGSRNFCMFDEFGKQLAVANSLWTLLDMEHMTFALPTPEMINGYKVEPKLDMNYCSRKIALIGEGKKEEPVVVRKHHLDTNDHVNNGQYVAIAYDYIKESQKVTRLRASYHQSAVLGDVIFPVVYQVENGIAVSLNDANGKPYSVVEFTESHHFSKKNDDIARVNQLC